MAGTYTVTTTAVTPQGLITTISHDFTVEFLDPCTLAIFRFAPGFLSADPIEYRVRDPAHLETFSDTFI